jgi:hypothetical protein
VEGEAHVLYIVCFYPSAVVGCNVAERFKPDISKISLGLALQVNCFQIVSQLDTWKN